MWRRRSDGVVMVKGCHAVEGKGKVWSATLEKVDKDKIRSDLKSRKYTSNIVLHVRP